MDPGSPAACYFQAAVHGASFQPLPHAPFEAAPVTRPLGNNSILSAPVDVRQGFSTGAAKDTKLLSALLSCWSTKEKETKQKGPRGQPSTRGSRPKAELSPQFAAGKGCFPLRFQGKRGATANREVS